MGDDRPLFILAGNGPYDNRGCEAIVRGTVKILREFFTDPQFLCLSHYQNRQEFRDQCVQETDKAITHVRSFWVIDRKHAIQNIWKPEVWNYVFRLAFHRKSLKNYMYKEMLPYLNETAAVLSIGGDNYSIDYGEPTNFTDLDTLVLEMGKPLIIWGASVGPFDKKPVYEKYMINHLSDITGIFARESVTVDYLAKIGVTKNVYPVADPAFLMDPVKPRNVDIHPIEKNAIGINLSPLMANYATGGDMQRWERIAANVISTIAKETSCPIYLIPHVITPVSDDFTFLKKVWNLTNSQVKNEINLIQPNYNAAETKWIISQMSLFAGARTHATIAALSSNVPTLSFAYSIKARGINRDIFGHLKYCLSPDQISPEMVTARIESMLATKHQIKNELKERIPFIQTCAMNAGHHLKDIIELG